MKPLVMQAAPASRPFLPLFLYVSLSVLSSKRRPVLMCAGSFPVMQNNIQNLCSVSFSLYTFEWHLIGS